MANNLANILDVIYSADINVARELTGLAQAAKQDFDTKGAALNQTINVPVAPTQSLTDFTPAATTTSGTDATPTTVPVTITASKKSSFHYTGEEERSILQTKREVMRQQIEQAVRALMNQVETDGVAKVRVNASRAYGTAGTTPFASTVGFTAQLRKILDDNGAPNDGRRKAVFDTTAGANLRTLTQLTKANEAGTTDVLKRGTLIDLHGFNVYESAQIQPVTPGTGTSYVSNGAFAVGATTIASDVGSGTILAGDVIQNTQSGRDSNLYVVKTALAAGSFVLNPTGIRKAWVDEDTLALSAAFTPNLAFHQDAVVLVARPPALDPNAYIETMLMNDAKTNLPYLLVRIEQYGQVTYEVHLAWGWAVTQPENVAIGLG